MRLKCSCPVIYLQVDLMQWIRILGTYFVQVCEVHTDPPLPFFVCTSTMFVNQSEWWTSTIKLAPLSLSNLVLNDLASLYSVIMLLLDNRRCSWVQMERLIPDIASVNKINTSLLAYKKVVNNSLSQLDFFDLIMALLFGFQAQGWCKLFVSLSLRSVIVLGVKIKVEFLVVCLLNPKL